MKLLCIGDPHKKLPPIKKIVQREKPDMLVCTGDYQTINPHFRDFQLKNQDKILALIKQGLSWKKAIEKLYDKKKLKTFKRERSNWEWQIKELASFSVPFLTVVGNLDRYSTLKKEVDKYKNAHLLHGNCFNFQGYNFIGAGIFHSNHFPEFKKIDKNAKARLIYYFKTKKNIIFITHEPPYKVCDKAYIGKHIGSKLWRRYDLKYKPLLHICGHVHEARGMYMLKKTRVVNCGTGNVQILEL